MPTFPTPEPISVMIALSAGDVRIHATDREDTIVEVRPAVPSRPADVRAAEHIRVQYDRGELRISAPRGWKQYSPFAGSESIEVSIELPSGSRVHLESTVGGVSASGRLAGCSLTTGLGDIRLDDADVVDARTGTGDVTLGHATGNAQITTSSGAIRARRIDGSAVVKNSYGTTRLGTVTGALRFQGAHGDLSVDRANASVVAKNAYGSVRIGEAARGSLLLESSYGTLEAGIAAGTAAWLDLSTQHGAVRNELTLDSGPGPSDETVEVRARNSWGDIIIRRSTEPEAGGSA
jgi:Putative adhesin